MPQQFDLLAGVHPNLVKVVKLAATRVAFRIHEGVRNPKTQAENFAKGVSKTLHSKHLIQKDGFGHAVDIYPVPLKNINDKSEYLPVVKAMKQAAKELKIPIICGYDWGWDCPHFELH